MHCFDLKVNVWRPFVGMALLGLILTACSDSTDNPGDPGEEIPIGDDASDKMSFKVTQTAIYGKVETTQEVALRYYDDMPHVAYIAVTDFQKILVPSKSIQVSRTAASQYQLVTSKGETATVNTAEESMTFDDFMSFVSLTAANAEVANGEDLYYVHDTPSKFSPAAASVTFDLKKYGIDLRGDGQMVYVPLTTLADIYSDVGGNHVLFNGEDIIMHDFETTPATIYQDFFMKPFETAERPADMAAYSYGELCFAIDHFYGRPGRNAIDNSIQEKGLDKALSEKHRTLLKSTKMDEYTFGLEYLSALLDDGGHTRISPINNVYIAGMNDINKIAELRSKYITAFKGKYPEEVQAVSKSIDQDDGSKMAAMARQTMFQSDTYVKIGNTMYCFFDDFGPVDYTSWDAYYKGTGSFPTYNPEFRGDICGIVEALDKAAADPEVKNFVLDLTCNNGGESDVLLAITNLLAGKNSFTYENLLTKQRAERTMLIDGNFDRVFDDKDKAPRHSELNIAIMTSNYAFSCGNLLPSLMKDYGYLIIGEKSGGGSCSIQRMCTAEGFCYILSSSRMRLTNKAGENIDRGVEPHIALEVKQATGQDEYGYYVKYSDFSAFYAPSVGEQIANWYANK